MNKILKIVVVGLVAGLLSMFAVGCGQGGSAEVLQSDHFTVDGIYVDSAYQDKDGSSLKMVYLFATVSAQEENMSVPGFMSMTVGATKEGEGNVYSSKWFQDATKMARSYYYSNIQKDVYVGESIKVLYTFKVPEGDLGEGKAISLSSATIPGIEEIHFTTDTIVAAEGGDAIAQQADPEGYEEELKAREDADADTTAAVQKALNDYEFYGSTIGLSYRISFSAPNNFELIEPLSNHGTYTVKNSYIELEYTDNGMTTLIPYTWKDDGSIDPDFSAFLGLQ